MKLSVVQKTAKAWNAALVKLNSAEAGQIAICYQDENGNKQTGYAELFDLQVEMDGARYKFGEWLSYLGMLVENNANAINRAKNRISVLESINVDKQAQIEELSVRVGELYKEIHPDYIAG